jgi:NTP pyrophosphatase (non-canonical NTP hydrolase)
MKLKNEFEPIRNWASERGIYDKGDGKTQCIKLFEEVGELSKAILNNDKEEMIDAIGDIVVVLTNLTELLPLYKDSEDYGDIEKMTIEDCINSAFKVIAERKGKMVDGTFIKDKI